MHVAVIQFAPRFGEVSSNLDAFEQALEGLEADLVVLPELCTTGYQFRDRAELEKFAESAAGPSMTRLAKAAAGCGGHVVAGFAERDGTAVYNSAALIGPQGTVGVYRKVHLFMDEKGLFDPGDLGFPVFEVGSSAGPVRVGLMVCFDWLFAESVLSLALAGAQVVAHPANLVLPYCQDAMVTRAIENRVFTITANRVGEESRIPGKKLVFTGQSRVVGPDGRIIAQGPPETPAIVQADIEPARADEKWITARNHVHQDRRPDQYHPALTDPAAWSNRGVR